MLNRLGLGRSELPPVGNSDDIASERRTADLMVFVSALMMLAVMVWLAVYWWLGQPFSTTFPLLYQALSVALLVFYWRTRNFRVYATLQISLFLFFPFVLQWTIGNFPNSSGVSLWGIMAPVAALVALGTKESVPYFIAFCAMTLLSGGFDYQLADTTKVFDLRVISVFYVLNFVAVSLMVYLTMHLFLKQKATIAAKLAANNRALADAQHKSERLLLNVLPESIAERLKNGETDIAEGHADVSVMFIDIVNFTHLAEEMPPHGMVQLLNDVFSELDALTDKFGLEKIKTIGDCYMVAGGLHGDRAGYTDHVADMALATREVIARYDAGPGIKLEVRIGIGTGPIIAGVIGRKKFVYDLWGDTVNVASRMMTEAQAGRIQVDPTTYKRLYQAYRFADSQQLYIKGKGVMPVYNLVGPLSADDTLPLPRRQSFGMGA